MTRHSALSRLTAVVAAVLLAGGFSAANAQFLEDAQRLALPGLGSGARALGVGNAYSGIATDFTALYWNPAGLSQAQWGEFSFGLSNFGTGDKSSFFNNSLTSNENVMNLNSLGFVLPLTVRRGSASVAFGVTRQSNFLSGLDFSGFNPLSSIVQTWAKDNTPYPTDISMAEELQLAQADTLTGRFISPIKNNVTQRGTVTETGGLNNWMIGGAVEVAPRLSVGVTLTYVTGSYRYDRVYREQDTRGVYTYPFDFSEIRVDDFIDGDISGFNGKFGFLYREPDRFRFGFTIKTPTWFNVKESYGTKTQSAFRSVASDGASTYGPIESNGNIEYDVTTPWVFGAGGSVILRNLMLTGDVEYTDWTQTQFSNTDASITDQNRDFRDVFRSTFNLRGGAEYNLPQMGLALRAGFIYNPSIYKNDPSSFDQKYFTAGLGVHLGEATMLDLGYAHGWWNTYRINYDATSRVDEKITNNTIVATLTHRF